MAKKQVKRKRNATPMEARTYDAAMKRRELRKVLAIERDVARLAKQYRDATRRATAAALELANGIASYSGMVLIPRVERERTPEPELAEVR